MMINKLKNIFKKNKEDDRKLYSEVIFNSKNNIIILVSYSSHYFYDVIEFINAAQSNSLYIALSQIEYESLPEKIEESKDNKISAIKPEKILHQRYYMLISGKPEAYDKIYYNINNLANSILLEIQKDIYNNISSSYFKDLIDMGILELRKFKYQNVEPKYNETGLIVKVPTEKGSKEFNVIGLDIIDKLPNGFFIRDILNCISIDGSYNLGFLPTDITDDTILDVFNQMIYKKISSNIDKDYILKLQNKKAYKFLDTELDVGENADKDIDDLFKESYERFNGTADEHQFYKYEDIDEILAEDTDTITDDEIRKGVEDES